MPSASIPHLTALVLSQRATVHQELAAGLDETGQQTTRERSAQQLAQLDGLVRFAGQRIPAYRERLGGAASAPRPLSWSDFSALPLLSRAELQAGGAAFEHPEPPPAFRPQGETSTSGSTGMPLVTKSSWASAVWTRALQRRFQLWHDFDVDAAFAFLTSPTRPGDADPPQGAERGPWAPPGGAGKALQLNLLADTDEQLDWLGRRSPRYLATYPSNLEALLTRSLERGIAPPGLEKIVLSSEPVSPELVALCRRAWGARALTTYSASEVGAIAFEEPSEGTLLVQAENLLVEVLRDDGAPCAPGEVGRIVVTTLQDFLRPLIRYEIGDYAEALEPLPSPRRLGTRRIPVLLPRLGRVLGRQRTMIELPDGRRVWPHFEFAPLIQLGCLERWQLLQKRDGSIDVRVVPRRELSEHDEASILAVVREALPGVPARLVRVPRIERTRGGKYLELLREEADGALR